MSAHATGGGPQEIALELLGTKGAVLSGTCALGDEEHDLGGRVPERFTYELNGRDLARQIRKQGAGAGSLRAVIAGDGVRFVQQTDAPYGAIRFSYSGRGVLLRPLPLVAPARNSLSTAGVLRGSGLFADKLPAMARAARRA